ncbi:unnamed protein product [Symbiodinium microadriaticum]|nr:unnamed protein product [Symbiodinium microadriaticum]
MHPSPQPSVFFPSFVSVRGLRVVQHSASSASVLHGMLKSIDQALAGAIDVIADDVQATVKSVREQGMMRTLGDAVEDAGKLVASGAGNAFTGMLGGKKGEKTVSTHSGMSSGYADICAGNKAGSFGSGLRMQAHFSARLYSACKVVGKMDMDYMDATLQVNAFGMTAGCTFCLDNLPNQLAVLGHLRAILEMCHNQCEGDSDQYESAKEVERQMKTVKLMIKMAQARSKSKAVKVEVMPCILSTSLNANGEASASMSMGSMSPKKSMSMVGASATGSMFCGKLPKLDEAQRCVEEHAGSDSIASTSSMVPTETVAEKRDKESASASASASPETVTVSNTKSGPSVGSATQKRPASGRSISSTQKAVEPVAPSAPCSSSSFASRLMPSFLRKNRAASKEKVQEAADGAMSPEALPSSAEVQAEPDEAEAIPTLSQLQQGTQGQRLLPIAAHKCATDYSASSLINAEISERDMSELQKQQEELWAPSTEEQDTSGAVLGTRTTT